MEEKGIFNPGFKRKMTADDANCIFLTKKNINKTS